nr:TonB-dependent receptor [uncultured Desulfuromonas sp.]
MKALTRLSVYATSLFIVLVFVGTVVADDAVVLEPVKITESVPVVQTLAEPSQTVEVVKQPVQPVSLTEALEQKFFVEFQKSGEYSSEPYIRGRGTKGVPVYLEGMRLNAGHNDSTNLFNLTDVEAVEVYRGPSAATLGMGAMSGAVVVKFKEPEFADSADFVTGGFFKAKTSLFSTSGYSTSLGARAYNDRFNIAISGGLSDYDDYEDGDGDDVLHSNYETSNYNLSMAMKITDDSYFYVRYMNDKADSEDPFSRYQSNGIWFYTDRPNDEGETCFIGYKDAQLGGLQNFHLQLFGTDLHYDLNMKKEAAVSEVRELFRDSETRGGKVSAEKELGNHLLSFSGSYSRMEITNGVRMYNAATQSWGNWMSAFGITDGEISSTMVNVADDMVYGKAFFNMAAGYEFVRRKVHSNVNSTSLSGLVPSALLDQVQQKDTDERDHLLSVSATAGYEFCPAFIPYVKVSNASRTPYFNEAYGNNPNNGSQVPNQELDNESVWGVDVGFDGRIGGLYYTSAFYYQDYTDYIELVQTGYKTTGGLPIKQYINLDDATVYGVEALLGYDFGADLFVEAAYLYTYGKNEMDDQPLAYIAPQKMTLTVGQQREHGLSWSIEEVMVDEQDRISTVNGEVATPGYAITNLAVSYAFADIGWMKAPMMAFELNNVLDRDYRQHLDKVSSTSWYLPDEAGINGVLSVQVGF